MKVEPRTTLTVTELTADEATTLEREGFVVSYNYWDDQPRYSTVVGPDDISRFVNVVRLHFVV